VEYFGFVVSVVKVLEQAESVPVAGNGPFVQTEVMIVSKPRLPNWQGYRGEARVAVLAMAGTGARCASPVGDLLNESQYSSSYVGVASHEVYTVGRIADGDDGLVSSRRGGTNVPDVSGEREV
jgi:hypothetical protein